MLHAPPAAIDPPAAAQSDTARGLVERQVAALDRLAEMGMRIAEAATNRAVAGLEGETDKGDRRDPTLAYGRAARAVRMCFALQTRLMDALSALDRAEDHVHRDLRQRAGNRLSAWSNRSARPSTGTRSRRSPARRGSGCATRTSTAP